MSKLEDYSRDELKALCKEKGVTVPYHNLSKAKLIILLAPLMEIKTTEKSTNDEVVPEKDAPEIVQDQKIVTSNTATTLSVVGKRWEAYFVKTKIEPEAFIARYPNHPYKDAIKELIDYKKSQK